MVAPRKTRKVICTIVRAPELGEAAHRLNRPSELLPWADPYIARLVHNLQEEVRQELLASRGNWLPASPVRAELEPPSPATDPHWQETEEPRWPLRDLPAN
jgi:hypothetical protein